VVVVAVVALGLSGCHESCPRWDESPIPDEIRGVVPEALYGDHGVLLTEDEGYRLVVRPTLTTEHLRAVNDDGIAWPLVAVGDRGTIRFSHDSGRSFNIGALAETDEALLAVSVSCADPDEAIAVGEAGVVAHTTDLYHWERLDSGVKARLMAVSFVYAARVISVGAGGTVLVSSDAGSTWDRRDIGTDDDITLLSMGQCQGEARPPEGLVATATGAVYFTEDAGQSWRRALPDIPDTPLGLYLNIQSLEAIGPVESIVADALTRDTVWRHEQDRGWFAIHFLDGSARSLSSDIRVVSAGQLHTYIPKPLCLGD
jgi:photosystem II stability/assembly factor-like uncharacterized protein